MKKGKSFLFSLILATGVTASFALAACNKPSSCTHDWKDTSVRTEATCTDVGSQEQECTKCGKTQTVAIEALGHDFSKSWSVDEEEHWHECAREGCSATVDRAEHADADKDHECDDCTTTVGVHESADGSHTCDYCGEAVSEHTGGKATCTTRAICTLCGEPYGELAAHDFDLENWTVDENGHYHACKNEDCTEKNAFAEHTFKNGVCSGCDTKHTFGTEGVRYNYDPERGGYVVTGYTDPNAPISPCALSDEPLYPEDSYCEIVVPYFYNDGYNGEHPVVAIGNEAFYYDWDVNGIVLPESVKEIGDGAFWQSYALQKVEFSEGLLSIGDSAFNNCFGLESIVLPESVQTIGKYAFYNCRYMSTLTVKEGVRTIGDKAFVNCVLLTSFTVPKSVTSLGGAAFAGCEGLTSLSVAAGNQKYHSAGNCVIETATKTLLFGCATSEIPADGSVEAIAENAFSYCVGLKSVSIPASVQTIGSYAFAFCNDLETVTIAAGVTDIGSYAFNGCEKLKSIVLPEGITEINTSTFEGCKSLQSVYIPHSVTRFNTAVFYGCSALTTITYRGSLEQWEKIGKGYNWDYSVNATLVVCEDNNGDHKCDDCDLNLSECADKNDDHNCDLCGAKLSDCGDADDDHMCDLCGTKISDHEGGKATCTTQATCTICGELYGELADHDFDLDTWIKDQTGHYHKCNNCDETKDQAEHTFEAGICEICGDYDTYGSEGLVYEYDTDTQTYTVSGYTVWKGKVVVPYFYDDGTNGRKPVGAIGDGAFSSKSVVSNVVLPDSITTIGGNAFYSCSSLANIRLSNAITSIGASAFNSCESLENISISDTVKTIGSKAFFSCKKLTSFKFPKSLLEVGDNIFRNTPLATIEPMEGVKYHCVNNCLIETATKTLVFGCKNSIIPTDGSITSIGAYAFIGCTGLGRVILPDSVTAIGESAFEYCTGLTEVMARKAALGEDAFGDCTDLTKITIGSEIIPSFTFYKCEKLVDVTLCEGVTTIEYGAFNSCWALRSVALPKSLISLASAFQECSMLTTITIAEGNPVYHVSGNCIIETKTKTLVVGCVNSVIPADGSVTTIGESAFARCTFDTIVIPETITEIGQTAFYYCKFTSVTLPSKLKSIGKSAFAFSKLTSIVIPESVTEIGLEAFRESKLTTATVLANMSTLNSEIFKYCYSLASVYISKHVTYIATPFYGCTAIKDVYYEGTEEEWLKVGRWQNWDAYFAKYGYTMHYNAVLEG